MVSGASSDPFVAIASAVAAATIGSTVAVSLGLLVARRLTAARHGAHERFVAVWRPLMFEHLAGGAPALPPVRARDEQSFLVLWIRLQDALQAEARPRLKALAVAVGARRMARHRLHGGEALGRMLALRTLGYLGDPADYAEVAWFLDEPRIYLCLAAARALVHLDPRRAPADILPRLAERLDWPVALFASALAEGDLGRIPEALRALLARLAPAQVARLLPLVAILDCAAAEELLKDVLAGERDPDVLCAALKRVATPGLLPQVRRAAGHHDWAVRTQAAAALGRIGGPPERDVLVLLLHDSEWWVRYRAARSLCSGRFGPPDEIRRLAAALNDRFARDVVEHARAEERR